MAMKEKKSIEYKLIRLCAAAIRRARATRAQCMCVFPLDLFLALVRRVFFASVIRNTPRSESK